MKTQKGITLIALVITIIVMLILVGVTLNVVLNGNLIGNTQDARNKQEMEIQREQLQSAVWAAIDPETSEVDFNNVILFGWELQEQGTDHIYTSPKGYKFWVGSNGEVKTLDEITEEKPGINKPDLEEGNYVGYYADIDIDGEVDGIIFVDLLAGSIRDTQGWGIAEVYTEYTLPSNITTNNVKSYYISQESYTDSHFGTHAVISPKSNSGENRFYIMQLSNFTTPEYNMFYWYKNAYGKMKNPLITADNFGEGKENTRKMIAKWNAAGTEEGYAAEQTDNDIWKHIQTKYEEGWFLPSAEEWAAFLNELEITGTTNGNYKNLRIKCKQLDFFTDK